MIPKLIKSYPYLNPVVVSIFAEPGLVQAMLKTGVRGYLLKDDIAMIRDLAKVVVSVANGNLAFSDKVLTFLANNKMKEIKETCRSEIVLLTNTESPACCSTCKLSSTLPPAPPVP